MFIGHVWLCEKREREKRERKEREKREREKRGEPVINSDRSDRDSSQQEEVDLRR